MIQKLSVSKISKCFLLDAFSRIESDLVFIECNQLQWDTQHQIGFHIVHKQIGHLSHRFHILYQIMGYYLFHKEALILL